MTQTNVFFWLAFTGWAGVYILYQVMRSWRSRCEDLLALVPKCNQCGCPTNMCCDDCEEYLCGECLPNFPLHQAHLELQACGDQFTVQLMHVRDPYALFNAFVDGCVNPDCPVHGKGH